MASEKLAAGLVNSGYSVGWVGACTVGVTATETAVTQIISGTNMTTDPRVLPISITGTLRTLVNSYELQRRRRVGAVWQRFVWYLRSFQLVAEANSSM